jgi:predicted RNase H-like HicB family nuclease/predicted DNA binding CopG/RHH family protein
LIQEGVFVPNYITVISRSGSNYTAKFPDFPALEAQGSSLEEIRLEAQGILEEHLATTYEEGKALAALTLDEIAAKAPPGAVLLALCVNAPKSRAIRINVTIPEDLLQAVDRAATAHSMSRSRFLANAVEAVVTGRRHGGVQIPLSESVLAAVDKAAAAHDMNRTTFLARIIEVGVGVREGHGRGKGHGHGCCQAKS